jgi:ubiquinol-cytochrome c reductase cytochrome c subunit
MLTSSKWLVLLLTFVALAPSGRTLAGESGSPVVGNSAGQGDAQAGKRLFLTVGCYECHGTMGAGANTGPRLAPNPMPWLAFIYQLRHPIGTPPYGNMRMPPYGSTVLTDAQAADIYAYLRAIKRGRPADQIPLLSH